MAGGGSDSVPQTPHLPPAGWPLSTPSGAIHTLKDGFFSSVWKTLCSNPIEKRKKRTTLDGAVQHLFKPSGYSRLLGLQRGVEASAGRAELG